MLNVVLQAFHQHHELHASLKLSLEQAMVPFGSAVQLLTGSEMEPVWRRFKPVTPKSSKQLAAVLDLERLADRLDAAMWRLQLRVDEMVQIQERFADSLHLVRSQDVDAQELIVVSGMRLEHMIKVLTNKRTLKVLFASLRNVSTMRTLKLRRTSRMNLRAYVNIWTLRRNKKTMSHPPGWITSTQCVPDLHYSHGDPPKQRSGIARPHYPTSCGNCSAFWAFKSSLAKRW
jgi:hypothetical protein